MSRQTVPQRVNEYVGENPEAGNILLTEMNEIVQLGSMIDIVSTAFAYGYMKGRKSKKGGAEE